MELSPPPVVFPSDKRARRPVMADNGGSNTFLAFIVGGLLVFVALVFVFGWGMRGMQTSSVTIEAPKVTIPKK
jgi:hypothetical protein